MQLGDIQKLPAGGVLKRDTLGPGPDKDATVVA